MQKETIVGIWFMFQKVTLVESPEINSHMCGQLTYSKGAKNYTVG